MKNTSVWRNKLSRRLSLAYGCRAISCLLREQVASSGMSFMTVGHAYQMLESQGRIVARPQSGYYVAARPTTHQPAPPAQVMRDEVVDINTYIFDVLQASRDPPLSLCLGVSRSAPFPASATQPIAG